MLLPDCDCYCATAERFERSERFPVPVAIACCTICYFNISDSLVRDAILGEFKSFPEGKHDDIVDAASYAYNYLAHDEENDYTPGFKVIKL